MGLDAHLTTPEPPRDAEVGATEQRSPVIAFQKNDRPAAPVAANR
jgi:hypothetical protein